MMLSCLECCTARPHPPGWRGAIMDSPAALAEWLCNPFRDRSKEPAVLRDSHSPPAWAEEKQKLGCVLCPSWEGRGALPHGAMGS